MRDLVLATHNLHKVAEFERIISDGRPDLRVLPYEGPEPVEDGVTFAENALIKARRAAEFSSLPALADDSGICVDVLGGAPGIFSAYWAGHKKDSAANVDLLLDQLSDIAPEHRAAQFISVIALVIPDAASGTSAEFVVTGVWPGQLALAASGSGGFGYDPIFVPDGLSVSAAELSADEKNAISHRARAFKELLPLLDEVLPV